MVCRSFCLQWCHAKCRVSNMANPSMFPLSNRVQYLPVLSLFTILRTSSLVSLSRQLTFSIILHIRMFQRHHSNLLLSESTSISLLRTVLHSRPNISLFSAVVCRTNTLWGIKTSPFYFLYKSVKPSAVFYLNYARAKTPPHTGRLAPRNLACDSVYQVHLCTSLCQKRPPPAFSTEVTTISHQCPSRVRCLQSHWLLPKPSVIQSVCALKCSVSSWFYHICQHTDLR